MDVKQKLIEHDRSSAQSWIVGHIAWENIWSQESHTFFIGYLLSLLVHCQLQLDSIYGLVSNVLKIIVWIYLLYRFFFFKLHTTIKAFPHF